MSRRNSGKWSGERGRVVVWLLGAIFLIAALSIVAANFFSPVTLSSQGIAETHHDAFIDKANDGQGHETSQHYSTVFTATTVLAPNAVESALTVEEQRRTGSSSLQSEGWGSAVIRNISAEPISFGILSVKALAHPIDESIVYPMAEERVDATLSERCKLQPSITLEPQQIHTASLGKIETGRYSEGLIVEMGYCWDGKAHIKQLRLKRLSIEELEALKRGGQFREID